MIKDSEEVILAIPITYVENILNKVTHWHYTIFDKEPGHHHITILLIDSEL